MGEISQGMLVELPGAGRALFTTRAQGNLSLAAGEGHERGLAMRQRLCDSLGLEWLCAGPQVHGTHVNRVQRRQGTGGQPLSEPADGHATALPGVGAMVLAADCVPVAIGMPGAVAAVHAGWRGLVAGVLEEGVDALRELGGDGEIVAAIGPCAGSCCYEVGEEVLSAFAAAGDPVPASAGRMLDLRSIVHRRLRGAGVAELIDVDVCTICDERTFSHRREGAAAGRQAGIAWLS